MAIKHLWSRELFGNCVPRTSAETRRFAALSPRRSGLASEARTSPRRWASADQRFGATTRRSFVSTTATDDRRQRPRHGGSSTLVEPNGELTGGLVHEVRQRSREVRRNRLGKPYRAPRAPPDEPAALRLVVWSTATEAIAVAATRPLPRLMFTGGAQQRLLPRRPYPQGSYRPGKSGSTVK